MADQGELLLVDKVAFTGSIEELEPKIAEVLDAAGRVWDAECRDAYHDGAFLVSREEWGAKAVVEYLAMWHPAPIVSKHKLNNIVEDIFDELYDHSSGAIQLDYYDDELMATMRGILVKHLGAKYKDAISN